MPATTRMPSGTRRRAEMPLRDEISKDIKFNVWRMRALIIGSRVGSGGHLHVKIGRDFSSRVTLVNSLASIWVFARFSSSCYRRHPHLLQLRIMRISPDPAL